VQLGPSDAGSAIACIKVKRGFQAAAIAWQSHISAGKA
jgi:hypothetical protein